VREDYHVQKITEVGDLTMKRGIALLTALLFVLQPLVVLAQDSAQQAGADTRLYLSDGTVIMGKMIERSNDLIIMQVEHQVHTFDPAQVDKIVTLESLGSQARTVNVREFPYISFLGGTVAFGLLSWLQFDNASDKDSEADLNDQNGLFNRAKKLREDGDRARLFGWSSAALALGSMGIALYPRQATRRIFPELSLTPSGQTTVALKFEHRF
jgi:hypothetical protein